MIAEGARSGKTTAITDRGYRASESLDSLVGGCTKSDPCYNPNMNQQASTHPQGSQHNFRMIHDDGTHTGLSSRFEEELAREAARRTAENAPVVPVRRIERGGG